VKGFTGQALGVRVFYGVVEKSLSVAAVEGTLFLDSSEDVVGD
jgi:hypothetical protein